MNCAEMGIEGRGVLSMEEITVGVRGRPALAAAYLRSPALRIGVWEFLPHNGRTRRSLKDPADW
jgi:hypothetical protein